MKEKIFALFDFCETITNFQTLEKFLPLVGQKNPFYTYENNLARREKYNLAGLTYPRYEALIDCPVDIVKKTAKEFLYSHIIKNINKNVINRLFWHQDQGHTIVIISGGFEIYIREFAKIYNIDNIVAIDLEIDNNHFTGNIDGVHTMQERKLYKLANIFNIKEYDLKKSYAYSDCVSDIPLLSFVGNPFVIECNKDIRWAKLLNFNIMNG
ncbi:HAD-IB family hydrolase [Campylobacter molothri]|uniref:HAD-IB family hydrolase n=1 Tax=Campylobacter molothri TaxID=1032242 RepID=A0ACC5W2R5_9BACT|nr:HAD-IB family hydrolase [Campylobacter sp. RM9929]MBZ7956141.1 HAD-IB family hydrolase [Campylobacter sp. RM17709]MBZ7959020.1 HAD-IB family hydrolase [Campylobacter sp. RM9760]MBZ7975231.1 HAD-IB family hydrolase [Campylobacter sp. RM9754]